MRNKKLPVKFAAVMLSVFWLGSCSSGNDWSGKVSGKTLIQKPKVRAANSVTIEPPDVLVSGSGTVALEHGLDYRVRLGKDTPLPDCLLKFSPSGQPNAFALIEKDRVYTGDTSNGKGCQGIVESNGAPTDVYFDSGQVTLSGGGDVTVFLEFRPVGSNAENRYFVFEGKKGWF